MVAVGREVVLLCRSPFLPVCAEPIEFHFPGVLLIPRNSVNTAGAAHARLCADPLSKRDKGMTTRYRTQGIG